MERKNRVAYSAATLDWRQRWIKCLGVEWIWRSILPRRDLVDRRDFGVARRQSWQRSIGHVRRGEATRRRLVPQAGRLLQGAWTGRGRQHGMGRCENAVGRRMVRLPQRSKQIHGKLRRERRTATGHVSSLAAFQALAAAQLKACRAIVDKVYGAAGEPGTPRRDEIQATATRMMADASAAQERLQQIVRSGAKPWSTLNAALQEVRAALDQANQTALDTLKRGNGASKN